MNLFFSPSQAAKRLGVSSKALRLYESRGLISPHRTAAGWRAYGPDEMLKARNVAVLRTLGFTLAQVAEVLQSDSAAIESVLADHQRRLERRGHQIDEAAQTLRRLRADVAEGGELTIGHPARPWRSTAFLTATFDLPWPWDGEPFAVRGVGALNFIVGPLGSGKTRFALRLSEALPKACFLPMERVATLGPALERLNADRALRARVEDLMDKLLDGGARASDPLKLLLAEVQTDQTSVLVIDMVEQGLDRATQEALMTYLRGRGSGGRPLFLLTRSSIILDLSTARSDETIIFCPANHSCPSYVRPNPGAPGYEALASCLATPEVRARTEGLRAVRTMTA